MYTSILLCLSLFLSAQELIYDWHFVFSGRGDVSILNSVVDPDGNSILVGYFREQLIIGDAEYMTEEFAQNGFIAKLGPTGNLIWFKEIKADQSFDDIYLYDVLTDENDGIYVTGSLQGRIDMDPSEEEAFFASSSQDDIIFAKYTSTGDYIYATRITAGSNTSERILDMEMVPNGNIYLGGHVDVDPEAFQDDPIMFQVNPGDTSIEIGWVYYLDSKGNIDGINEIIVAGEFVYITGSFNGAVDFDPGNEEWILDSGPSEHTFVVKLAIDGTFHWALNIGSPNENQHSRGRSITVAEDGGVYILGEYYDATDFDPGPEEFIQDGFIDSYLLKLNAEGEFQWVWVQDDLRAKSVKLDAKGNPFIASHELDVINIRKINSQGQRLWKESFDGESVDIRSLMLIGQDVFVSGNFSGRLMVDPVQSTEILSTDEENDAVYIKWTQDPTTPVYSLEERTPINVYPNPVVDYLHIRIDKVTKWVNIVILDAFGLQILEREYRGKSRVNLPVNFPPGSYFVHITTDHHQDVKKLIKH